MKTPSPCSGVKVPLTLLSLGTNATLSTLFSDVIHKRTSISETKFHFLLFPDLKMYFVLHTSTDTFCDVRTTFYLLLFIVRIKFQTKIEMNF